MDSVGRGLKKALSVLLGASTLLTAPGADAYRAFASELSGSPDRSWQAGSPDSSKSENAKAGITPVPAGFLDLMRRDGFITGPADPLVGSLITQGAHDPVLTSLGEFLYQYEATKSQAAAQGGQGALDPKSFAAMDRDLQSALGDYAKGDGPARQSAAAKIEKIQQRLRSARLRPDAAKPVEVPPTLSSSLAQLSQNAGPEEAAYEAGQKAALAMQGGKAAQASGSAAAAPAEAPKLTRVTKNGQTYFYDQNHQEYAVTDAQGKILRSLPVKQEQEAFNRQNIPDAPHLSETGVWDVDTLKIPYYQFKARLAQDERFFHFDRTVALAEILGKDKSYTSEQYDPDNQRNEKDRTYAEWIKDHFSDDPKGQRTLEQSLEDEHPGYSAVNPFGYTSYRAAELLDPLFSKREIYLLASRRALAEIKRKAEAAAGGEITQDVINDVQNQQFEAQRLFDLSFLYGELYHLTHYKAKLTSKDMREALDQAPVEPERLAAFRAQIPRLANTMDAVGAELERLIAGLESVHLALAQNDPRLPELKDRFQALSKMLPQAQDHCREAGKEFNTFTSVLGLLTASDKSARVTWKSQNTGIRHPLNTAGEAVGYAGSAIVHGADESVLKLAPEGEMAQRVATVRYGTHILEEAFDRVADGHFDQAYAQLGKLAPGAYHKRWSAQALGGSAEPTDDDKISASVAEYSEVLGKKAAIDEYSRLATKLVAYTALYAVAAPALSAALARGGASLVEAGNAVASVKNMGAIGRGIAMSGNMLRTVALGFDELNGLSGVPDLLKRSMPAVRIFNATRKGVKMTAEFAGISGGMSVIQYNLDAHTPFKDWKAAAGAGAIGGAKFAVDNLWMGYYAGTPGGALAKAGRVGRVFNDFGSSGLVGGTAKAMFGTDVVMQGASWLRRGGLAGGAVAHALVSTDMVAKFYAIGEASSALIKPVIYQLAKPFDPDPAPLPGEEGLNQEQITAVRARISDADAAGMAAMGYSWMLMPGAPEGAAAARQEGVLSDAGWREYSRDGKLHELVNAAGQERTLNDVPKPPSSSLFGGGGGEQRASETNNFRVSEDMAARATRETLKVLAPTVPELFRITRLEGNDKIAKPEFDWSIEASDVVREQAQKLLEEQALADPKGTQDLLKTADAALKDQLSRIYMEAYPQAQPRDGLLKKAALKAREFIQTPETKAILDEARVLQAPRIASEREVDAKGAAFVAAVAAQGPASEVYKARIKDLTNRTEEWSKAAEKGSQAPYRDVIQDWNANVQADPALSAKQKATSQALTDYIAALDARFQKGMVINLQGKSIKQFRPGQQNLLTDFLAEFATGVSQDGKAGLVRHYLMLDTGGGKTLLTFEGILPIAKADAAAKGKKLAYMTANSNLVTQAELDYKAFGRLDTPLEIITMDEFSTRVARGRNLGGERAEDYWLMADELDKMAEDPVKSVGRTSATIAKENETARALSVNADKMEAAVQTLRDNDAPGLVTQARRALRFLAGELAGEVGSDERAYRARQDIKTLKAEQDRLFQDAVLQGDEQVAALERAVDLKKKKPAATGPEASPLSLEAIEERLAAAKVRRQASRERLEEARTRYETLVALADKTPEDAPLDGAEASRRTRQRKAWVEEIKALGSQTSGKATGAADLEALLKQAQTDPLSPYRLRDAAKVEQLGAALAELSDAAATGDKTRQKEIAARYEALVPEAVDARDWKEEFKDRRAAWLAQLSAVPRDTRAALDAAAAGKADELKALWSRYDADLSPEESEALLDAVASGTLEPARLRRVVEPFAARQEALLDRARAAAETDALSPYRLRSPESADALAGTLRDMAEAAASQEPGARKKLDALVARHEDLLPDAVVTDRAEQIRDAAREYRETLAGAISTGNRMYDLYAQYSEKMGRLVDSPLRQGNRERSAWAAELRAAGKDAFAALEKAASAHGAKPDDIRKAAEPFQARIDELLAKASPGAAPYKLRDTAKVAELKSAFVSAVEEAATGDLKAAKEFSLRYEALVPEAVETTDWLAATRKELDVLSKQFARDMIDALYDISPADAASPLKREAMLAWKRLSGQGELTASERNDLYNSLADSEKSGRGWARKELEDLARGHLEDISSVRYDRQTGKVFTVHVGQWMERMDNPTRRYWELHYGADLTMPFKHDTEATVRDITANRDMNYVGLSGTKQTSLELVDTKSSGRGTQKENDTLETYSRASQMYQSASDLVQKNMKSEKALTYLGVSNQREAKIMLEMLRRTGVSEDAIAVLGWDTEYLRTNRPKARVQQQMNLEGLKTGKVKVVILNVLIGGRGLDLDMKSFGYNKIDMAIFNPESLSPGHLVQTQGRIAPNRVPAGATRTFYEYVNIESAAKNEKLKALARKEGVPLDARFIEEHLGEAQRARERELLENSRAIVGGRSGDYALAEAVLRDPEIDALFRKSRKGAGDAFDPTFLVDNASAIEEIVGRRLTAQAAQKDGNESDLMREVLQMKVVRDLANGRNAKPDADFLAKNAAEVRQAVIRQLLSDAEALQRNPSWDRSLSGLEE